MKTIFSNFITRAGRRVSLAINAGLIAVAVGTGCTSARSAAKPVVLLTLQNVRTHQDGIQARIDVERQSYASLATVVEIAAVESAAMSREAQQYLAVAKATDLIVVEQKGVSESALVNFLLDFDDKFDASLVSAAEGKVRTEARERTAMANLARDEAVAATVEEQLMLAAQQRTSQQEVQFLVNYAQGVQKKLKALKELDKLRIQATTKPTTAPVATTVPTEP